MPTHTESFYSSLMLSALSHCEAGRRLFTGANAGGTVADGEVLSQGSTYPDWYSRLCEHESGEAIRRNLGLVAAGKENRRGGQLTKGWVRVMRAVQYVMANGDEPSMIWPDPTFLRELGRHEEAESVESFIAAQAEADSETPDDLPTPTESLRESAPDIHPRAAAAIPMLAPYCQRIEVRGWFTWAIPADKEAEQALLRAGFSRAVKFGGVYGPPERARNLPHRPCHHLPAVTVAAY